jgi:hypothetical protein
VPEGPSADPAAQLRVLLVARRIRLLLVDDEDSDHGSPFLGGRVSV